MHYQHCSPVRYAGAHWRACQHRLTLHLRLTMKVAEVQVEVRPRAAMLMLPVWEHRQQRLVAQHQPLQTPHPCSMTVAQFFRSIRISQRRRPSVFCLGSAASAGSIFSWHQRRRATSARWPSGGSSCRTATVMKPSRRPGHTFRHCPQRRSTSVAWLSEGNSCRTATAMAQAQSRRLGRIFRHCPQRRATPSRGAQSRRSGDATDL